MAIVTLADLKGQLNFTPDLGTEDDALLLAKIDAAQDHVERMLGFRIAATFGGQDQDPIPPSLAEAVLQLAAHWYENRETASPEGLREVPFGVSEIVSSYREWSF